MVVTSPQGWFAYPELVLAFYNERSKYTLTSKSNQGYFVLADFE